MCTSGTAVANLHPAVLEAFHARVPLVVVTADRPLRLRGTDANQTTDQVGIFGPQVSTLDVDAPGAWDLSGVVHLNVQLDDPLLPEDRWVPDATSGGLTRALCARLETPVTVLELGPRTVVVAGDDAGPRARSLAAEAGWPLLAEPSSGARTGPALRTYRLLLATELADQVERVVVFGHPTLSRPVQRLLSRDDVEVVDADPAWTRPYAVTPVADPAVDGTDDPAWLAGLAGGRRVGLAPARRAGRRGRLHGVPRRGRGQPRAAARRPPRRRRLEPDPRPRPDGHGVRRRQPPQGDRQPRAVRHRRHRLDRDRRLARAARRQSSRNLALMGDVTFLHDANGLVIGPDEPRPDLTIVVANDDGGSIFATLEQGAEDYAHAYERLFGTPHHVDLAALCQATRTPHWRVDSAAELDHALASPNGGIEVVEAVVDRTRRRELDQAIRALRP